MQKQQSISAKSKNAGQKKGRQNAPWEEGDGMLSFAPTTKSKGTATAPKMGASASPSGKVGPAADKKSTAPKTGASASPSGKVGPAADKKSTAPKVSKPQGTTPPAGQRPPHKENSTLLTVVPVLLVALSVFLGISLFPANLCGSVGQYIRYVCLGLFSHAAYALPALLLLLGIFFRRDAKRGQVPAKILFGFFAVTLFATCFYIFSEAVLDDPFDAAYLVEGFTEFDWDDPASSPATHGGFFGYLLGWAFGISIGVPGTVILILVFFLLTAIIFFDFNPLITSKKLISSIRLSLAKRKQQCIERAEQQQEELKRQEEERKEINRQLEERKQKEQTAVPVAAPAPARASEKPITAMFDDDESADAERSVPKKGEDMGESPAIKGTKVPGVVTLRPERVAPEATAKTAAAKAAAEAARVAAAEEADEEDGDSHGENRMTIHKLKSVTVTESIDPSSKKSDAAEGKDGSAPLVSADKILVKTRVSENPAKSMAQGEDGAASAQDGDTKAAEKKAAPQKEEPYKYPPIDLLATAASEDDADAIQAEININAEKLVATLDNFNVKTSINSVSRGPRITRYELAPDKGVRVRSIANLVDDIALNLATSGIRIEAPIPGKPAVGVEVPNKKPSTVRLRDLLVTDAFRNAPTKTTVCIGSDVGGDPVVADLAKMPHMLIAGATGMGKSVCINTLLISLLYKARPDEVKLILVDPKKVELNVYSGIPHLLVPVVSDPKKAAGALSWAVNEMERRFSLIEAAGVRDIKGYTKTLADHPERERLCHLIIIIDELADLMMSASDSVEASIVRIAQKARAAGIHLVIGTQRPSVDVVTGLIKANVPSRISFKVSSQVDSRTIIDMGGAEKLLNNGDMLFAPVGIPKPRRVQGAFVDDSEVEKVTTFLRENFKAPEKNEEAERILADIDRETKSLSSKKGSAAAESDGGEGGDPETYQDPKFQAAVELAFESKKIATSLLQRRLSIGYGKAAKLIDEMQRLGIVSPPDGQKPRDVIMTYEQWLELQNTLDAKSDE